MVFKKKTWKKLLDENNELKDKLKQLKFDFYLLLALFLIVFTVLVIGGFTS